MKLMGLLRHFGGLLAAILLLSSTAFGFYFKSQDEIYLSSDFDEDVFLAGSTVNFDGMVVGDLFMAARTATFNGDLQGNLHTVGRYATVNGSVDRSYRGFAQYVIVNADVSGDATIFCQELTLSNDSRIGRDAAFFCAAIFINGAIEHDAHIYGAEVSISGRIEGNVKITAEKITITPTAYIGGNLEYSSEEKAKISSEAQIMGETKWKKETSGSGGGEGFVSVPPPGGWLFSLVFFFGSVIVGVVLVLSKRAGVESIVDEIKSNGLVAGALGLAIVIICPFLIAVFAITVVGFPLAFVGFAAYGTLFWVGKIFAAIALGVWILGMMKREGKPSMGWGLIVGLILLALLFKVPFLGWLVYILAWSLGAGALTLIFFRRYRNGRNKPPGASADTDTAQATA